MSETLHDVGFQRGDATSRGDARGRRDARPWLLLIALLVVLLDRVTKRYVAAHVLMGASVRVVPRVFWISHVLNTGAAFSLFADSRSPVLVRFGLVGFSLAAAIAVFTMLWLYGRVWSLSAVGFALVLGGAVGNLYDRAVYHYVVDFLEVHIASYHFPDFNVADSCITVGAVLLIASMVWPAAVTHPADEGGHQGNVAGDARSA